MEDHQATNTHISNNNNNNNIIKNNNNINTSSSSPTTIGSGSGNNNGGSKSSNNSSEQVRSRWTPKPEQILILESIFNSGMVNPTKEETVRIRKLLEKFGAVGDANVFYWFQNRRSRSRRRQRQLQASLAASVANPPPTPTLLGVDGGSLGFFDYGNQLSNNSSNGSSDSNSNNNTFTSSSSSDSVVTTSFAPSIYCSGVDDIFTTFSSQMGVTSNQLQLDTSCCSSSTPILCPSNESNLEFQPGIITVFINGVATQVEEGPVDMKAMFGEQVILVHSSGVPVPFDDFDFSFHSLQHGETYFLVPRHTT